MATANSELASREGRHEDSARLKSEAFRGFDAVGDQRAAAGQAWLVPMAFVQAGKLTEAREHAEEAIAYCRRYGLRFFEEQSNRLRRRRLRL